MNKKETIFREGDRVYDPLHGGWGSIESIRLGYVAVYFKEQSKIVGIPIEIAEARLSFTEYKLSKEGFSQERPMPTISMPYLNKAWKYIAKDRLGIYVHVSKPFFNAKRNLVDSGSTQCDTASLLNKELVKLEFNTIYKIVDND